MDKNKLILPISIVIGCIILGAFFYAAQVNKQRSIEKQQEAEIAKDKKAEYLKRKIECEKYTEEVKKEMNPIDFSEFGISDWVPDSFELIFYSPKDNSCLYVTQRFRNDGEREYFIYNVLTKSKITSFIFPEQYNDYKQFILEYSEGEIRL